MLACRLCIVAFRNFSEVSEAGVVPLAADPGRASCRTCDPVCRKGSASGVGIPDSGYDWVAVFVPQAPTPMSGKVMSCQQTACGSNPHPGLGHLPPKRAGIGSSKALHYRSYAFQEHLD